MRRSPLKTSNTFFFTWARTFDGGFDFCLARRGKIHKARVSAHTARSHRGVLHELHARLSNRLQTALTRIVDQVPTQLARQGRLVVSEALQVGWRQPQPIAIGHFGAAQADDLGLFHCPRRGFGQLDRLKPGGKHAAQATLDRVFHESLEARQHGAAGILTLTRLPSISAGPMAG